MKGQITWFYRWLKEAKVALEILLSSLYNYLLCIKQKFEYSDQHFEMSHGSSTQSKIISGAIDTD